MISFKRFLFLCKRQIGHRQDMDSRKKAADEIIASIEYRTVYGSSGKYPRVSETVRERRQTENWVADYSGSTQETSWFCGRIYFCPSAFLFDDYYSTAKLGVCYIMALEKALCPSLVRGDHNRGSPSPKVCRVLVLLYILRNFDMLS